MTYSMRSQASPIVRMAARRACSFGAASLISLIASVLDQDGPISAAQARDAVEGHADADFLDDDWFWLPGEHRNRLRTLAARILGVASPLDLATVRAGVCRTYAPRHLALVPPAAVMEAFFRVHPSFAVDALDRLRPSAPFEDEADLGKSDELFVDVLRLSWTGVLDAASFREACAIRGMTARTFNLQSAHSAVLDQPADDLWCLRGTRVSSITAIALRHAKAVDDA